MAFIDYYKVLGVPKSADEKAIKKAYRKLARKYHPDVNPNNADAEKKFKEINEAHEVLGNVENRKKYDKYGKDWKHAEAFEKAGGSRQAGSRASQGQNYQGAGDQFQGEDFSDFFNSMFGGAGGSSRSSARFRGQDFNAELQLNLTDIYETHKRTLTVNGKDIRLTIPAGVKNGQTIKITGKGSPGMNGGPNGDLYIKYNIINNSKFKREADTLYSTEKLDLYTALLGGDLTVDTFTGKVKLKVKPETQNGTLVRLKGKGFPVYKKEGVYGDLLITYEIELPKNLTQEEKELVIKLQKLR